MEDHNSEPFDKNYLLENISEISERMWNRQDEFGVYLF